MVVNQLAALGTEAMDLLLSKIWVFLKHGSGRLASDRGGAPVDAEIGCHHGCP